LYLELFEYIRLCKTQSHQIPSSHKKESFVKIIVVVVAEKRSMNHVEASP